MKIILILETRNCTEHVVLQFPVVTFEIFVFKFYIFPKNIFFCKKGSKFSKTLINDEEKKLSDIFCSLYNTSHDPLVSGKEPPQAQKKTQKSAQKRH